MAFPEAGAQLKQYWASLEQGVEAALLAEKFDRLMSGLFTANELDAQSTYNNVATTRHISYAAKDYSSIPDDQIKLSDDDLRAAYNEDKAMYRINEPLRSVDYIMVSIEPSQEDRVAARKKLKTPSWLSAPKKAPLL